MSGKHTEGPWMIGDSDIPVSGIAIMHPAIKTRKHATVARMASGKYGSGSNETMANARLIAAAPELLEALKLFVGQWNACGPNSDFGRYFQNVRDAAVDAISKAEGTAP